MIHTGGGGGGGGGQVNTFNLYVPENDPNYFTLEFRRFRLGQQKDQLEIWRDNVAQLCLLQNQDLKCVAPLRINATHVSITQYSLWSCDENGLTVITNSAHEVCAVMSSFSAIECQHEREEPDPPPDSLSLTTILFITLSCFLTLVMLVLGVKELIHS